MVQISRKHVSVILLNFNGKSYLKGCLDSLKRQTYREVDVIFVDNASTDGSVEYVKQNFPWVRVIANSNNVGFAEGNNIGVKYTNADYLVFLNCDTEVDPKWLELLIEKAESADDIAICGSKILDMQQKQMLQEVGGLCDVFGFSLSRGMGEIDKHQYDEVFETFYVSGASLLVKRQVADQIGLFDPQYFFNQEDVDVCWRAHLAGYKVVVNPLSVVYHKGGGSAEGAPGASANKTGYVTSAWRRYYAERNIIRTLLKNYSYLTLIKLLPKFFFLYFLEFTLYAVTGRLNVAKAYLNALWWNLANLKNTWSYRREVQKLRVVHDEEIQKKMIRGIGKLLRYKQIGNPRFK